MKTFEELGVSGVIRKAIEELGFVQPMPVQEAVIPYLLENKNDVIALAQTGTGKTAAFGIPLLMRIDTSRLIVAENISVLWFLAIDSKISLIFSEKPMFSISSASSSTIF